MSEKPLWQWSATEIASATQAGQISASDATEAAIARMEATNPDLNAVVESLADEARAQAASLDSSGKPKGPLHGVPVTIKVNVDQTGHATTNGVPAFKDMIAPDNAPLVNNLKAAGAVVIGRTNTPEFSFRADTDNPLHGRTYNRFLRRRRIGGHGGNGGVGPRKRYRRVASVSRLGKRCGNREAGVGPRTGLEPESKG